ncbi:flagellar basal body-associated protein FliL [Tropicimonas sp. S265A]|uniref:flagellar basal body-associated protein FliL n=1 Tax=Tropicimonas sp. S265A TaxID=3415134 RepID=UPI003C7B5A0E
MRLILPVLGGLIGVAGGVGAAYILSEPVEPEVVEEELTSPAELIAPQDDPELAAELGLEYIRLNNQFVVPVVRNGAVSALVILSLTVEADAGTREAVFAMEPKLRDALLSTLFDHANTGGFEGVFTETHTLAGLRAALRETAKSLMPETIRDILIMDLVRQDTT